MRHRFLASIFNARGAAPPLARARRRGFAALPSSGPPQRGGRAGDPGASRWPQALAALAVMIALMLLAPVPVAGQAPSSTAKTTAADTGTPPRTPDGQPDLQGVWDFRTLTPLQRPSELDGKQVFTDLEAAEFEEVQLARQQDRDNTVPADIVGNYNQFWFDPGTTVVGTKRTSLIVDPPDGRIPPLTPAAQKREAAEAEARRGVGRHQPTPGGWVEELGPQGVQVRCLVGFNSGPPIVPGGYNQNVQLFQTPDYVVILNEMIHTARIVPLDGRPHLGQHIRQWAGDSRGRWEGQTLVVDTTNFLRETAFRGSSANLHLIERFTRVDADTLLYEFTVDDPTTWTRAWTAQLPMRKSQDLMYEYACHEGNYGFYNILAGARAKEKADEEAARKRSR